MNNSRRSFIKISALGASGIALSATAFGSVGVDALTGNNLLAKRVKNLKRTATYCEVCFLNVLHGLIQMKITIFKNLSVMK